MPRVRFLDEGIEVEVSLGTPLAAVCDAHEIGLPFDCRNGICGTCAFTPEEGEENLGEMDEIEHDTLAAMEGGPNRRLACRCVVEGGATVRYGRGNDG